MLTMPENTDEYEVILPLKGPDGDQLWTQGTRRLNLNPALVVFQNCENPEILLRWIDTFQEPEFVHSSHLGPEGYLWEIDPETKEYVQPKDSIDALRNIKPRPPHDRQRDSLQGHQQGNKGRLVPDV